MAQGKELLSARTVATLTRPGRHADGGGLYLVVDKSGSKRWSFLFRRAGKLSECGLGGLNKVSLANARRAAEQCREWLGVGLNPIEERRRPKTIPTFGDYADAYIDRMQPGWRNAKHAAQWRMTLTYYAEALRSRKVDDISTEHVLKVLRPIWATKPETASRLRGRIEKVLDAAKSDGHRSAENPARWRGHLDNLLPRPNKLSRGHHAAMPFDALPEFIVRLRELSGVSARALEFTILTAARSGEVLGARWSEFNLDQALWTVPAGRMKAGRMHRVPLSQYAMAVIEEMKPLRDQESADPFVFPGAKRGKPLSSMALEMAMRRLKIERATVHGFRSSFRDWAGDATEFPREVAEAALAHIVGDQAERAYRRGDALAKRRALMSSWGNFCASLIGIKAKL